MKVNDVDELRQRIQTVWDELDQRVIGDVAIVIVLLCPASSASVTAVRWEPVNVHVSFWY